MEVNKRYWDLLREKKVKERVIKTLLKEEILSSRKEYDKAISRTKLRNRSYVIWLILFTLYALFIFIIN